MHVPSAEELAAIAAAYLAVSRTTPDAAPAPGSRWSLAARIGELDAPRARVAAVSASRWNAAGRLRG